MIHEFFPLELLQYTTVTVKIGISNIIESQAHLHCLGTSTI